MAKNPDKKSSEYWEKRFQELENRQHGMSVKRAREIMVNFDRATSEIEQKITYWYQRIADNNNISLQEARKILSDAQLKEFKWSVDDYIKYGKQNAIDGRWMKELENASARAHISRLEALKLQVRNEIEKAYAASEEELASHMESVFKDSMYHTAYELQKGLDRCETFAKVSPERVRKVMDKPWCPDGKTFSSRIWEDRDRLVNSLDTQLTRMCITGAAPDKVIKEMTKLLGAKKSNVARLVMTESAYISSAAQKECFKELDVEQYKVLAVLDSKTSEICQEMDGQVFKMSEYQEGVTAPPFHPNCRSTTIPYFDDEWFKGGSRSARDKDGNYIEVPEDMTYAEWKREFVDGEGLKEAKQDDKMKLKEPIVESVEDTQTFAEMQSYMKDNYGITVDDSVGTLDFQSVREGVQGVEYVIMEFPQARSSFKTIGTEKNGLMCAGYDGDINFNPGCYQTRKTALWNHGIGDGTRPSGLHPKGNNCFGSGSHEAGHILEKALVDKSSGESILGRISWNDGTYAKAVVSDACKTAKKLPECKGMTNSELKGAISRYAKQNASECLAEAVCDVCLNGEEAAPLAKIIWKILKKELG